LVTPRSAPRAARIASFAGQVAQYSRAAFLHREHGLSGRSRNCRTAATSLPLAKGRLLRRASRSARADSADSGTMPRSRTQVRQRYSTVSTGNTNSVTTSSGAMPRSKRANAAAAMSPVDASSSDAGAPIDFVVSVVAMVSLRRKSLRALHSRASACPASRAQLRHQYAGSRSQSTHWSSRALENRNVRLTPDKTGPDSGFIWVREGESYGERHSPKTGQRQIPIGGPLLAELIQATGSPETCVALTAQGRPWAQSGLSTKLS